MKPEQLILMETLTGVSGTQISKEDTYQQLRNNYSITLIQDRIVQLRKPGINTHKTELLKKIFKTAARFVPFTETCSYSGKGTLNTTYQHPLLESWPHFCILGAESLTSQSTRMTQKDSIALFQLLSSGSFTPPPIFLPWDKSAACTLCLAIPIGSFIKPHSFSIFKLERT